MMYNNLKRSTLPEKMDDPSVPRHEVEQALRELENVNKYLGGYSVILDALEKLSRKKKEISIMDIGCGGGDVLRKIASWAKNRNLEVTLIGVDCNPLMTQYAKSMSLNFPNISYRTISVWDLSETADITMNSLFCHHFDDNDLVRLIRKMNELSTYAVVINDIHRHWFAYHSIKWITGTFSKTYLVKYDAPLSVARSLKRNEWIEILKFAEIKNYNINWKWAWRWQIIIPKN